MLSAIGSPAFSGPAGTGSSFASLQAQLERCQKQLSDNVNCSSANTRAGKETIQALSNKIGEIKARMQEAEKQSKPPSAQPMQHNATAATSSAGSFSFTTIGTRLDVFA